MDELPIAYPTYDVLRKRDTQSWNDQTRAVIDERLHNIPRRNFFSANEWQLLEAICTRLLPQPDRPHAPIPIVPWLDRRLAKGGGENYRRIGTPPEQQLWRDGLAATDDESQRRFADCFASLCVPAQDALLACIQTGVVVSPSWQMLSPQHFFTTMLVNMASVYYSHPSAWNELGFGGPASPRGYVRLGPNQRDPWEAKAQHGG